MLNLKKALSPSGLSALALVLLQTACGGGSGGGTGQPATLATAPAAPVAPPVAPPVTPPETPPGTPQVPPPELPPALPPGTTPDAPPATTPATPPGTTPVTPPGTTPVTPPSTTPVTPPETTPVTPPGTTPVTPPATTPVTPPATTPVTPPTAPVTPPDTTTPVAPPVTPPTTSPVPPPVTPPSTAPVTPPVAPPVTPPATPQPADPLAAAMAEGDVRLLTDNAALFTALRQQISQRQAEQTGLLQQIWGSDAISYNPTRNAQLVTPSPRAESARVYPVLVGNGGYVLASAGRAGASRVAAIGNNLIGALQAGTAPAMLAPTRRLLSWMLTGQQQDISAARSITLLRYSSSEQTALKAWFKTQYPAWTVNVCADDKQLAACTQGSALLLAGSQNTALGDGNAAITAFLQQALGAGTPLLYQHTGSWGSGGLPQIASLLDLAPLPANGNYFSQDQGNWANLPAMLAGQGAKVDPMQPLARMVNHLANSDYAIDWTPCSADDRLCSGSATLNSEFYLGANQVKTWIANLEGSAQPVFAAASPALIKQLVLLGDQYRRGVRYPMSVAATPTASIMQALYADHALASLRTTTPAINLQGSSFSPVVPETVPAVAATRSVTTRTVDFATSGTVSALPGRSFTVKRTDAGTNRAWVFVNYLQTGAGHIFGARYDRPLYLTGNAVPLAAGQSITITHPYGGLVFVQLEKAVPAATVQLQFSGIGQHAVYNGAASGATFAASLASTQLGWAEILIPGFEVHSTTAFMRQTLQSYGGSIAGVAEDTSKYMYQDIYNLAGFNGYQLALPAAVAAFCQQSGWDCTSAAVHGLDGVQHFNADQAHCGSLCSGQPIDSYYRFTPNGWGEGHEMGHNLQVARLKVYGAQSDEVSNNIFPLHMKRRYDQDHPTLAPYGRNLGQKATFDLLQAGVSRGVDHVKTGLWYTDTMLAARLQFYWQTAMDNRSFGDEGWDLFRLLYLHERLVRSALASDAAWSAERAKLGFPQAAYASRSVVQAMSGNDHLLVALSLITQRDQRPWFDMWGITYSADAASQVGSFGYPAAVKRYWIVPCEAKGLGMPLASPVPVDGASTWPAAGNCPA